ncbi:MAG: hypothetical protein AAGJ46_01810 [Planctomycetota bacterium]
MASLELDPSSGRYRVRFRYAGQAFKRSLRTKRQRVANAAFGQVEQTLRLLELGMVSVPAGVEPGRFIVSGARLRKALQPESPVRTVGDLFRVYEAELPAGAKEQRTLEGERLHFKHLGRHLKPTTRVETINHAVMQRYIERRSTDKYRGRSTGPDTIKKEVSTLRMVWNWARAQGYLDGPPPVDRLLYSKRDERPPFLPMADIRRRVDQSGLSKK